MSFRSKYIPIEEACRRLGMDDRKDMILFCQRFMIPMTKIWGVQNPTISPIPGTKDYEDDLNFHWKEFRCEKCFGHEAVSVKNNAIPPHLVGCTCFFCK